MAAWIVLVNCGALLPRIRAARPVGASKAKGRIKEAAGDLTGREDWQAEGQMDQLEGSVRSGVGRAGERLSDIVDDATDDRDDER